MSNVRPETVLRGHQDAVNCLGFHSEEILSSGSVDGILKLWSISSRRAVFSVNAHADSSILSINTIFHSSSLLTSGRDGYARLWQIDHQSSIPLISFQTGARHFCNSSCDKGYLSGITFMFF